MKPLVPKIKVGDILKGTKNLRAWLQSVSILTYLQETGEGDIAVRRAKSLIYTPSKDDKFMVVANAWNLFVVCSVEQERKIILIFNNHLGNKPGSNQVLVAFRTEDVENSNRIRMNPTIFSQWFIRTNSRMLDINTWDIHAVYFRATMHLNGSGYGRERRNSTHVPTFHINTGFYGAFNIGTRKVASEWDKPALTSLTNEGAKWGTTRKDAPRNEGLGGGALGPHLGDLDKLRTDIKRLCTNPRLLERLKKKVNIENYM